MNKRYDLLDEIRDHLFYSTELRSQVLCGFSDDALQKTFEKILDYYGISNLELGGAHGHISKVLYMNKEFSNYDSVAGYFHVHINTLNMYRQKYNKLAKELIAKALWK